ncbi:hypothetical protein AAG570_001794 [Ranatra chinensis]|uniref:protein-glutamine gamma-glutamyltransferase n=1 Tax=Ranatra chinensis TaxID=642074 RepID=A0ABD0YBH7_9HEMI
MRRDKNPQLIVRRGQPFKLELTLSRAYSESSDGLSLIFTVDGEKKPSYGQGTLVGVPLLAKGMTSDGNWSAHYESSVENVLTIQITPAPDCVVGKWKLDIDTKLKNDGALSYTYKGAIYILFNAWCKSDSVFLNGEDKRKEYVLADTGLIWRGSYNRMQPTVWKYAQYETDVLDCALYLLKEIGKLSYTSCADPIKLTRAVSAAVNSPDDNGCLLGNWTSEFEGGTPPSKWVGSMKIMQKFYKYKKPVKYGQCWVFAGVVTTICRALGIPARTITTYSSAHDTHNSLTVDYFVDESGEVMEELINDSIWNFHVWNEAWMKRPDLGLEYDGWQVIDATPQELSDNMYQCGPAPVMAVKNAEVRRPYDAAFVYAEVNADKIYWKYFGPTQPLKLLRKDMHGVGQFISTKAVGEWKREDITENYKYSERSEEERASMLKALKQSESLFSRYYLNEEFNDIKFYFKLRDDIVIGSPFSVVVVMHNKSRTKDYSVSVVLRVDTVLYTGKIKEAVKKEKFDVIIKHQGVEEVKLDVSYNEYASRIIDQSAFNIACLATVHGTNYEFFAQDDFRTRKPDIKIKIDGETVQGQVIHAVASLTNPLPVPLKKGQFMIEGPGLDSQLKLKLDRPVEPKAEAKVSFKLTPKLPGRSTIAAKFISKELDDVDGFINFMVREKGEKGSDNGVDNSITT